MPEVTYFIRFVHRDGNVEWWEHVKEADAREHFNLLDATDADIYSEIQLFERRWNDYKDTVLEKKVFG